MASMSVSFESQDWLQTSNNDYYQAAMVLLRDLDCSQPLYFLDANSEREGVGGGEQANSFPAPYPHARALLSVPVRSRLQRSE